MSNETEIYIYLMQLYCSKHKNSWEVIKRTENMFDSVTFEELNNFCFTLDNCHTAYYNFKTILSMFVEHQMFLNPMSRQPIHRINKVQLI